jgi:hypothetical protein
MLRRLVPLLALLAAALVPPAAAAGDQGQSTMVISTAMDGRPANGDSVAPAISGDRRWARYIAFESDATNLVASTPMDSATSSSSRAAGCCAMTAPHGPSAASR